MPRRKTPRQLQWLAEQRAIGEKNREAFVEAYALHYDPKRKIESRNLALQERGLSDAWFHDNVKRFPEFDARLHLIREGRKYASENRRNGETPDWDGSFNSFREVFLGRTSAWFHVELSEAIDAQDNGDIMLVIWPPESGKTATLADRATMDLSVDPTTRMTIGHERKDQAENIVGLIKSRFEPDVNEYARLRERFGPFAPINGMNGHGQPQAWGRDHFNVHKRLLGQEVDFNLQALGYNSGIAGTRCDRLLIDDPQSRKSLNLTEKIVEKMRDDWFTRPGVTGKTVILMNVVGDGDVAEELIRQEVCEHVSILKAYDENYLLLGPRERRGKAIMEPSPWLWPERYTEADYLKLKKNAGAEGWARKYQQEWRPSVTQHFTRAHIDACRNELRSLTDPPPRHPSGADGEIAVSIDPGFGRTAVSACAFEPTQMVVLDTYAQRKPKTLGEMVDLVAAQIAHWHRPGLAVVRWVIVETKGFQKGVLTEDRLLELQADYGFSIIEQQTGWDKHNEDFGVTMMARSMERSELSFPAKDRTDDDRFEGLYREMLNWRPDRRGNKLEQDELMALWFCYQRWHRLRRKSIRRGVDASQFGFAPLPGVGELALVTPRVTGWSFGHSLGRPMAIPSRPGGPR